MQCLIRERFWAGPSLGRRQSCGSTPVRWQQTSARARVRGRRRTCCAACAAVKHRGPPIVRAGLARAAGAWLVFVAPINNLRSRARALELQWRNCWRRRATRLACLSALPSKSADGRSEKGGHQKSARQVPDLLALARGLPADAMLLLRGPRAPVPQCALVAAAAAAT